MPSGYYARKSGNDGAKPVEMKCVRCGSAFTTPTSIASRRKYCSHACQYAANTERVMAERACQQCGAAFMKKRYHPQKYCSVTCRNRATNAAKFSRAGWKVQPKTGYIICSIKGRTVLQHRFLMEQHLGRELKDYENIHHKNGDRADNRIENLEVWIVRPRPGQRQGDTIEWCVDYLRSHGYEVNLLHST